MTYEGLHGWYKQLFEKLGWVILHSMDSNNEEYRKEQIEHYYKSAKRLKEALDDKKIDEEDRKKDKQLMKDNLDQLLQFYKTYFSSSSLSGGAKKKSKRKSKKKSKRNISEW
jgi:hypothetical protein